MKKIYSLILLIFLSFSIYANESLVYTSVSHEMYRADYVGSHYYFSNNETSYSTKNCFSFEFGYKEYFSEHILFGVSYGYSFVFFNDALIMHYPFMIDTYYQKDFIYGSMSIGTLITDNEGSITTVPNFEVGVGVDIPIGEFAIGLKSSVSLAIWGLNTNISDFALASKVKPLEVMFMVKTF